MGDLARRAMAAHAAQRAHALRHLGAVHRARGLPGERVGAGHRLRARQPPGLDTARLEDGLAS